MQDIGRFPRGFRPRGKRHSTPGPPGHKTVHLVKRVLYAARGQQTPFQTHVRAALRAGATFDEVEHALLQLLTAEGLWTCCRSTRACCRSRRARRKTFAREPSATLV